MKAKVHLPHIPEPEPAEKPPKPPKDEVDEPEMIKIPIMLRGKKMAYLAFPDDYTDQDLQRIQKVINAYVEVYKDDVSQLKSPNSLETGGA